MSQIAESLRGVQERVSVAAKRSGRKADEVQLMVVSKTWPVEVVQEAVEAGRSWVQVH